MKNLTDDVRIVDHKLIDGVLIAILEWPSVGGAPAEYLEVELHTDDVILVAELSAAANGEVAV